MWCIQSSFKACPQNRCLKTSYASHKDNIILVLRQNFTMSIYHWMIINTLLMIMTVIKYDAIVTTTMRRTICARIQFYWFVLNTIWDPNERWYIKMYTLQMINETATFTPFYMAAKCIRPEIDYSLTSIHLSSLYFNKDMLLYEQKSSNRSSIA